MKTIILNSNIIWTITQFRKDLIKALKNKYTIICVADDDKFSDNSMAILDELDVKFIKVKVDRKGINPLKDIFYIYSLYKIYKKIKPDLIIHYTIKPNIYGSLVARILNIKSFAVISGLGSSFLKDNFLSKIIKKLYKFALQKSNKIFFLNNDDMKYFVDNNIVQKDQKLLLPGEGVDTDYYSCCNKDTNEKITFLMIARLLKDKGIYEYIETVKKVKSKNENVEFLLAGVLDSDNPTSIQARELQAWIDQGVIKYLGKTDDIREFLKLCDVIVLPSYREGLSRVLLEACSCEKFIITSDIAGCKELCEEGKNGFLCKPKDIDSLTKAFSLTISLDKKMFDQMSKKSREMVINTFSSEIVNNIYLKVIKETI